MKHSPIEFAKEVHERLLALLWRQWAQLGLASAHVPRRDGWAVDPEALLLTTCVIGRRDPRLFDEVLDWLRANAHFVNLPRAKSLSRRFALGGDGRVLAAVCEIVRSQEKSLNWRAQTTEVPAGPESFFLSEDGKPQPVFGHLDPTFLRWGYQRGSVQFRGLSRQFNAVMPECALLRLRALVGVTARAEILLYLLTHKISHPSGIARATGFSQKNIQDALVDMEASDIVHSGQLEGRMKGYFILARDRAPFLYQPNSCPPTWVCWPPLWRALLHLWEGLGSLHSRKSSRLGLAADLLSIADQARPNLGLAGFGHCFAALSREHGEEFVPAFEDAVRSLFCELDEHASRQPAPATSTEIGEETGTGSAGTYGLHR